MLDINGSEITERGLGQLLCEIVSVDPAEGVRVRILNSEVELLIGCKHDEALGGMVADSELAMMEFAGGGLVDKDGNNIQA
jgi:hypothetical protein